MDLTTERCETKRKIRDDTVFYHGDAETFIMKAFSYDRQYRHHSTVEKVKLNPIGEITHKFVSSSFFFSEHPEACQ